MPKYELRDNSGTLFRNTRKTEDEPTQPDYRGDAKINGQEFWMNAWVKQAKNGGKFMSFSFRIKRPPQEVSEQPDFNDEVPF